MTKQSQRIAIAEACGTLKCPGCAWPLLECSNHGHKVSDYLNDLNAMHEAEKIIRLSGPGSAGYRKHLITVCKLTSEPEIFATAAQRAEAFLRVIGKWVDA